MRFLVFFPFIPHLGLCLGFFWNFSIFFILHTFGRFLQRAALKNFIAFRALILESQRSLERVKKCIQGSPSALRSLQTSKGTDNSVTHVSRGSGRGIDFESQEPNLKLKAGCNVWQILWLTIVWLSELLQGNFCGNELRSERKQNWLQLYLLCFILYDQVFLSEAETINFSASLMEIQPMARQITTLCNFFYLKVLSLKSKDWVSSKITCHNSTLRNRRRAFHGCPEKGKVGFGFDKY